MKRNTVSNVWQLVKRKVSAILIVSMILTGISPASIIHAKSNDNYLFVEELEIDESLIDEGMFYMPYSSVEVNENDSGNYVFKVRRKGSTEKAEKVKLSMVDMSGKYDRDYRIRVIDKALFSENIKNAHISKSVEEFMRTSDYEEYNFSDAIIDGSVTADMVLEDEDKEDETVSGFTNSETEKEDETESTTETESESESESESTTYEVVESTTETEIESSTETETTIETETTVETDVTTITNESTSVTEDIEDTEASEEATTASITEKIATESIIDEENNDLEATKSNISASDKNEMELSDINATASDIELASISEIVYGSEEVKFESNKASMSTTEGYELATGLTSDRKKVALYRNPDYLGLNKNSLEDTAYMREGIEVIEEELKSAYVILEFKEGQSEKLIEISILNDNKYRGDRQVGFNLSSVDESQVAGMYSSLTLIIHDDEEMVPSYISFTKTNYEPENGYITVEIERSGELSSVAACMIDTEDITAKGGRDYSKVHAKLIFGMGLSKRTVKIPIRSNYVGGSASFKLKLQEAQGALIGDNGTAICTIKKTDKNFGQAAIKSKSNVNSNDDSLFGSGVSSDNFGDPAPIDPNGISIHDVSGGKDYDLDSIILADPINMKNAIASFYFTDANDNSYHKYINNDQGMEVYLENHSIDGEDCSAEWSFYTAGNDDTKLWSYNGFQLEWSCDSTNADILIQEYMEDAALKWHDLYKKYGEEWTTKTTNFFMDSKQLYYYYFKMIRYDGFWRTSPTLKINSLKPILKMFKINIDAAAVPELIGDDGNKTTSHKYAKYAITSLDGAKTDHTAVGFAGKTITVKLDNNVNNPFYIKNIYMKKPDGSNRHLIVSNEDTSVTSLSFKIDEDFIINNDASIDMIDRPGTGGGHIGEFTVEAELGTKPATIKIKKDDRVDVNIWNDQYPPTVTTETLDYTFNIGDVIHFFATMKPSYSVKYKCDGLNVYNVVPYSPDWNTIRRPDDGSDYFPMDASITEVRVEPEVSQNENKVVVYVNKKDIDSFDQSYGLFATATKHESGDNYIYDIETDATKITGRYFDIKARCTDADMTPVWYEAYSTDVMYTQNEYYFLGSDQIDSNIIYLTCEKADDTPYTLVGSAYYEEVPIGGKTADKYWQAATNIGILIDETHFAYSDNVGTFSTIPLKGKSGYYNRFKIVSDGTNKYADVMLNNDLKTKRTYTIEYAGGAVRTVTQEVYEVHPEVVLISNVQNEHPHVDGVTILNLSGTSFDAVYINDQVTVLKAAVTTKDKDGNYYTYTYIDEDGVEHTEDEHVKRIEYVVIDKDSHQVKTTIVATQSNADETEWTAYQTFERGNYALYMSDDKLYVRVVTDRKVGDGKGEDIDPSSGGGRQDIPAFNETTYQAVSTSYQFIEESAQEPYIVDFPFPADSEHAIELPIIGNLNTMLNAMGMSFGITSDGDRTRLYIGKKFNGGGNRYDGNGKTVSDTGYEIGLSNFKNAFSDMTDFIKESGTKRLKTMTLGIPTWTFEPIIGVYFEFMLYHDPSAHVTDQFLYTGGGGYFGGILDLRYTFYFLVLGIPCYVGGEVNLSLVAEFGVAVDDGQKIVLNDPSQSFFDDLFTKTHFEFLIRSILVGSAYVGAGVAGTIGIRGGFELTLLFIYNPFVKKKYPQINHTLGFSATGAIKLWADAVLVTIPIPLYEWPYPFNLGYFKDVENIFPNGNGTSALGGNVDNTLRPRPRFESGSTFTANNGSFGNYFGGTYVEDSTRPLVTDVYDASMPRLMKYQDDKALLVYLDDDHSRGDYDRTVLKYMLYNASTDTWTAPQNVWDGNDTADFYPNLCDCGDKILLSWTSRPDPINAGDPTRELLKNMEVWTMFFDKASGTFDSAIPEQITIDDAFDYYPQASYDSETDTIHLYYIKKQNIPDINTATDLLNEIQTEVNGSYLMYMLYTDPGDGGGKRWLRDFYFDHEYPNGLSPAERTTYITEWGGQRFKNLSIDIGGDTPVNHDPNISDFATIYATIFDTSDIMTEIHNMRESFAGYNSPIRSIPAVNAQIEDFNNANRDKIKSYNLLAYVVESDGDPTTKNDTDIYLKLQLATKSETKTIRITHNNVPDTAPKFVSTGDEVYLFWIQNESMIKMLALDGLITQAIEDNHASNGVKDGDISIQTLDKVIIGDTISNFYPFTDENNNVYLAWQQNSQMNTELNNSDTEIEFKQDLYVAGLTETIDATTGETVRSWSNPVRFSNNGKVNDLPTAIGLGDKIMLVNNQYNLNSTGDSYRITNSNLQETQFKAASSMEISSLATSIDTKNSDGSIKYKLVIIPQNTGLFAAEGYDYTGNITYNGTSIASINGGSAERVLPGQTSFIGGASPTSSPSVVTPEIYFTLSREQQHHLDKVKVDLNVIERNVGDAGSSSSKNVFDVSESFSFVVQSGIIDKNSFNRNLRVIQTNNGFEIKGILTNNGNIDSFGNEKIYVVDQNDWNHPIAESKYINLPIGNQLQFSIPIGFDVLKDVKHGVKDLVLYVKNDEGKRLSNYEIATVNARIPFDIKVNGEDKILEIEKGNSLPLSVTYEPSSKYKNLTILYSIEDGKIARTDKNVLYGITEGKTKLRLTTDQFSGSKEIEINVLPSANPRPSGGGGGGGGGGSAGPMTHKTSVMTVQTVKAIAASLKAEDTAWVYEPVNNTWQLKVRIPGVEEFNAKNGFFIVNKESTSIINGVPTVSIISDTYYFDADGKMYTGWLGTMDGKWYFFEDAVTKDEGKMIYGWKNINNAWYYFSADGSMLVNAMTPDGFLVGMDGKWIN